MIKETRFRVFDKHKNKFIDEPCYVGENGIIIDTGKEFIYCADKDGLEATQYIGLKDFNGVDIHEMDFQVINGCRYYFKWDGVSIRLISDHGHSLEVKSNDCWGKDVACFSIDSKRTQVCEVSGNIYEQSDISND